MMTNPAHPGRIADPITHTLALYCFSVLSRDEVDTVGAAALAAGASEADGAEDYGFMYSRSFFDPTATAGRSCGWTRRRRSRAPRRSPPDPPLTDSAQPKELLCPASAFTTSR